MDPVQYQRWVSLQLEAQAAALVAQRAMPPPMRREVKRELKWAEKEEKREQRMDQRMVDKESKEPAKKSPKKTLKVFEVPISPLCSERLNMGGARCREEEKTVLVYVPPTMTVKQRVDHKFKHGIKTFTAEERDFIEKEAVEFDNELAAKRIAEEERVKAESDRLHAEFALNQRKKDEKAAKAREHKLKRLAEAEDIIKRYKLMIEAKEIVVKRFKKDLGLE